MVARGQESHNTVGVVGNVGPSLEHGHPLGLSVSLLPVIAAKSSPESLASGVGANRAGKSSRRRVAGLAGSLLVSVGGVCKSLGPSRPHVSVHGVSLVHGAVSLVVLVESAQSIEFSLSDSRGISSCGVSVGLALGSESNGLGVAGDAGCGLHAPVFGVVASSSSVVSIAGSTHGAHFGDSSVLDTVLERSVHGANRVGSVSECVAESLETALDVSVTLASRSNHSSASHVSRSGVGSAILSDIAHSVLRVSSALAALSKGILADSANSTFTSRSSKTGVFGLVWAEVSGDKVLDGLGIGSWSGIRNGLANRVRQSCKVGLRSGLRGSALNSAVVFV